MTEFLNQILLLIENAGLLAYLILFLISVLESVAFVGLVMPGGTVLVFAGFVVSQEVLHFWPVVSVGAFGSFLGDLISFYLGYKGFNFLKNKIKFFKEEHVIQAQEFFKKHGGKSVFLARFLSPLRPMIPLAAGLTQMNFWKFLFWNLSGGIVFSFLFVFSGFILGESWHLFKKWFTVGESLILLLIFMIGGYYFWRNFIQKRKEKY